MLNKVAKISLVATSLAPIFFTLWIKALTEKWDDSCTIKENTQLYWDTGIEYFLIAWGLVIFCILIIWQSKKRLEKMPVKIKAVKTVDKEIVGFILVYLLPLINSGASSINNAVLIFVAVLFFFIIYNTHSYHFNPLLGFFNFHFYEVVLEGDITYILITKKDIRNCQKIKNAVQLTEYMLLEA